MASFEELENSMKADDPLTQIDLSKINVRETKCLLLFQFVFSFFGGTLVLSFVPKQKIMYLFLWLLALYAFLIYVVTFQFSTLQYWIKTFQQNYAFA